MMIQRLKPYTPYIVLSIAVIIGALSIFGDNSFSQLESLKNSLEDQRRINAEAQREVHDLRREVRGLQTDPRAIEKAARNELGMARPNERVFIFDDRAAK